jgi:tight adherence protein C
MTWLFWALLFGSLVMLAAWRDALRARGLAEEAAALAGAGVRALRRRSGEGAARALLRLLGPLGRLARPGADAEALLRQAGAQMSVSDFAALKAAALVGLGAAGLAAGAALGSLALAALFAAAGAAAGNVLPDWLLSSRAAARRAEIAAGVPALVDVLAACAAAGLGIHEALRRVAPRLRGPLGAEVRRAVAEASAGATLREALESMARRAGVPEAERLAESLALAVRYGTPVADALRQLSEELRAARRTRAEEFARRAEVRAVIPVAAFIFLPLLALMVAPALMMLIQAFGAM